MNRHLQHGTPVVTVDVLDALVLERDYRSACREIEKHSLLASRISQYHRLMHLPWLHRKARRLARRADAVVVDRCRLLPLLLCLEERRKQRATLAMALLPDEPEIPMRDARALLLYTKKFGRHVCWAHEGWWGTTAMYCPDIDVAVVTTIDQTLDDDFHGASRNRRKLLDELAAVLDGAFGKS